MTLRLKGRPPPPGQLDRRYYMIDVQHDGRRVRLSTRVGDREAAAVKEQAVLDALRQNSAVSRRVLADLAQARLERRGESLSLQPKGMTLKEACDQALADPWPWGSRSRGWADSPNRATYEGQLAEVQRILGADLEVTAIDQDAFIKLVVALRSKQRLGGPNSGATVNRKLFALASVLRRLHERGLPAPSIPRYPRFDESEGVRLFTFTAAQEKEILDAVAKLDLRSENIVGARVKRDAHAYHDLFVFLADAGCRLSAALDVKWTDLVDIEGTLCVRFFRARHLKGGRPRTTPLTSRAVEAVLRSRARDGQGPFDGLSKNRAERIWSLAKASTSFAAEPDAVIHALRHTCATRLLQVTGDIKLVQDWLGHTSIKTTADTYAKVLVRHKVKALSPFEMSWTGGTQGD